MNNLQQVVQRAKADIAKGYVFVHMPIPQLETLLSGLEEAQREIEGLEQNNSTLMRAIHTNSAWLRKIESEHTAMKEALERIDGATMSMFATKEDMVRYIKGVSHSSILSLYKEEYA